MRLTTSLLPHQQAAVEKLLPLRIGALYMEMGTGKTRTALEMIQRRLEAGKLDRVLWLCPCSVRGNLRRELRKHCEGDMSMIHIHGIESLSGSVRLAGEMLALVETGVTMLVVDESNLVKNHAALRTRRITAVAERCRYRLLLNGTPVTRNETDLYSQWYLLDWRVLGYRSYYTFAANHIQYDDRIPGKIVRTLHTDYLSAKIAPYSFEARKEDCMTLPKKHYHTFGCYLTDEQEEHYDEAVDDMLLKVDELQPETIYRMFAALQLIISGNWVQDVRGHLQHTPMFEQPEDNPRVQALLDALQQYVGAEKSVIFCKYTQEILTLQSVLERVYGPGSTALFYGGVTKPQREASLARFTGDAQFLLANKTCAGYGLNLQFCRNIVYYSNDWDYGTRAQSEDRVHRLGQTREPQLIDLYARFTLDERILSCLRKKESLADEFKSSIREKHDLKAWLKGGTHGETLS